MSPFNKIKDPFTTGFENSDNEVQKFFMIQHQNKLCTQKGSTYSGPLFLHRPTLNHLFLHLINKTAIFGV